MDLKDPRTQKYLLVGILAAAIVYVYFFSTFVPFGHRAVSAEKQSLETEYQQLSTDLSKARQTLSNREDVERQYKLITERWGVATELLPEQREVANLLRKVTLVGQQSGVDFELFKPLPLVQGEVYVENPVQVKVAGGFHEVGAFLAEVANLDRIVNVSGLVLETHEGQAAGSTTVTAQFTATAYTLQESAAAEGDANHES